MARPGPITRSMGGRHNSSVHKYPDIQFSEMSNVEEGNDFDRLSVHSEMEHDDFRAQGRSHTGLQNRCHSESALDTGIVSDRVADRKLFEEKIDSLKAENRSLALDVYLGKKELETTQHNLYKMSLDLSDVRNELETAQNELTKYKHTNREYQNELQVVKQVNLQMQNDLHEYKQVNLQYKREIEILKDDLQRKTENIAYREPTRTGTLGTENLVRVDSFDYNHGYSLGHSHSDHPVNGTRYNVVQPGQIYSNTGTCSSVSHPDEPKFRLPYYNGKGDFPSFWNIFQLGVKKFKWDNDRQVEQLLCCLKDDALAYVTRLPSKIQGSISQLHEALERRYGDHLLPEQYRENLNQVKQQYKESLSEYASRVTDLVHKAYPDLNPPELVTTLIVENLLRGLSDQTLAYEVRTKSPKSVDEALRLITWHDCCKSGIKKNANIRQGEYEDDDDDYDNVKVLKVNGGHTRFINEE